MLNPLEHEKSSSVEHEKGFVTSDPELGDGDVSSSSEQDK